MYEEGSIRFGRFAGVPIIWNFTLLFIPAITFLNFSSFGLAPRSVLTVALSAAVIVSILLHEAGHVWMARRFRIGTEAIVLHGFGGLALLARRPYRRSDQIWISVAGPLVNLALALVGFALLHAVEALVIPVDSRWPGAGSVWGNALIAFVRTFARINLLLGLINLLPALPLDGGAIARSLLARWFADLTALRITAGVGIFVSLWLCTGAGVMGVGALAMGLLLVFLNILALRRPYDFLDL